MAITETGYHRPTFEEILSDLTLKTKELFGEDIDVSDQTPLGKLLNIMAYVRGKDHEEAELIYYSRFPNTASGINLDRLCPFVGITRNPATPARYTVTVTGEAGTIIPVGFLVSTESGIEFYNTIEAAIADGQTTCTITVECTEAGTMGNVVASDIVEIVNPEAGIDSVLGASVVSVGEDEESDYALRNRILQAGEGAGSCNEAAIRAALMKVPTVTTATVVVNDTDETDAYGNPPHSIACYVAGGTGYEKEIGEAIFETKPVGIPTKGTQSVSVTDDGGYSHTIYYNTMQSVAVAVAITISTTADYEGATGAAEIQSNVTEHINGLGFGADVILSALYGHIYSVKGVARVTALTINGGTSDISISELQCAVCSTVTVTEV